MNFEDLADEVALSYQQLGHQLGWRFVTSPRKTVSPNTKVVLLTLNPGGSKDNPDHPSRTSEAGSAYVVEAWGDSQPGQSKLQIQVKAMYNHLGVDANSVLSGQLVPFRSVSWEALPRREESLKVGIKVWTAVLTYVRPALIIAMGKSVLRPSLLEIFGQPNSSETVAVDWGAVTAVRDSYDNQTIISIPHLSRYGIMTRQASQPALRKLFAGWTSAR